MKKIILNHRYRDDTISEVVKFLEENIKESFDNEKYIIIEIIDNK